MNHREKQKGRIMWRVNLEFHYFVINVSTYAFHLYFFYSSRTVLSPVFDWNTFYTDQIKSFRGLMWNIKYPNDPQCVKVEH